MPAPAADPIVHDVRARWSNREKTMPRYIVEREFPDGLQVPIDETGAKACLAVVDSNIADQVTWVHSYVSMDKKKSFCVYDAPSPEAIRRTAGRSKLPVGHITEVRVLDPYFYK
jgi:Protein of unknown function (DUF4242)